MFSVVNYCSACLTFNVMVSFAKKVLQPPKTTFMMVSTVADLVSDAKFEKTTKSLHEILPTHVNDNFKIYQN